MFLEAVHVYQDKHDAFAPRDFVMMCFQEYYIGWKKQVVTVHGLLHELVRVTGAAYVAFFASVELVLRQALKSLVLFPQSLKVLQQQPSIFASVYSDTPVDAFWLLQLSVCAA